MLVISFESTHHAMFGEKMLKKAEIPIMVIPTPRELDKSCGISIKISDEDMEKSVEIINRYNIDIKGIYKIEKGKEVLKVYSREA